jgi:predicted GIY-YIG superfamily endonuclease
MKEAWVYILLCSDGSYYTGCTTAIAQRIAQHEGSAFDGYTSKRLPVKLVFSQSFSNVEDAVRAERRIKGWSRKKKEALIRGDYSMLHSLATCKNETSHKSFVHDPLSHPE